MSQTEDHDASRRDFLYYATAGAGVVTTGAVIWPLINQMNPSADVQALSSIFVDIGGVEVGKPVFIRRRTAEEIEQARAVPLADLVDRNARNPANPAADASDQNRTLDPEGEWLVMTGVCTHLGCVPLGNGAGDFNGWFCPCHGSHYDTSGRIRRGPAPENLPIPVVRLVDDTTIQLG